MTASRRTTERRRAALLAPGERWGWEYRLPAPTADPEPPPSLPPVPDPDWTAPAADRYATAVRQTVRYRWPTVAAAALAVAALVLGVGPVRLALPVGLALAAVALVGAAVVVSPRLLALRAADAAHQRWLDECLARRGDTAPPEPAGSPPARSMWPEVRPVAAERVDVYGGDDRGWAALLSTVAGSVLGSGGSVTVLDLTGQSAARELIRVAGAAGHRLDLLTLPDHLPAVGLLSDLAPAQVGTVLAEAVHAVDRDSDTGDRASDAGLVGQAVTALRYQGPGGPLTFRRVAAALRALDRAGGGGVPGEASRTDEGALTMAERANLAATLRQIGHLATGPRLRRLAAAAGQLALLEEHDPGVRPYRDPHAQLRVMQLLGCDPELSTGLLAQVLAGTLLHQVRRQVPAEGPPRLLVVAGADGLRRAQLERLDALTRRRGIRLVLAYRRLRPDATAPTGTDATILMRQGSPAEAEHAARLIGSEHQVLVAEETAARRVPLDESTVDAEPAGRCPPPPPVPALPPRPMRRVSESFAHPGARYVPTAGFLRELPDTAFLLLDPRDPGAPRLVESNPT